MVIIEKRMKPADERNRRGELDRRQSNTIPFMGDDQRIAHRREGPRAQG